MVFSDGGFRPVKPRKATEKCQSSCKSGKSTSLAEERSDNDDENERSGAEVENGREKLFACPNEGCIKTYQRFGSMVINTLYGQCVFQAERESLIDTAKVLYCRKLLGENSALTPTTETAAAKSSLPSPHDVLDKGWALRSTKTSKPFSEKQRRFLEEKFTIGETTGRKLDPVTVAREIRVARGSDGQWQFTPEELLTANQIQGFFSRRTKSKNQTVIEVEDDFVTAEVEDAMASVRNEVINQTQPIHPVTFDGYNLCDRVATGKLCKLTVSVLRDICCHFEPEMSSKSQQLPRPKAPYVEILEKHVRACSCFDTLPAS